MRRRLTLGEHCLLVAAVATCLTLWRVACMGPAQADSKAAFASITNAAFSSDGCTMAVGVLWCGAYGHAEVEEAQVWHLSTGRKLGCVVTYSPLRGVGLSPDGTVLVTAESTGVRRWQLTGAQFRWLPIHGSFANAVGFSRLGDRLAIATDADVEVRSGRQYEFVRSIPAPGADLCALSPDSDKLLCVHAEFGAAQASVWDIATGTREWTVEVMPTASALGIPGAWSPDVHTVAVSTPEGGIQLVDVQTGRPRREMNVRGRAASLVAFSREGNRLALCASGSQKGHTKRRLPYVGVYELVSGAERALIGHTDQVYALCFLADNRTLATASYDGTIRLWDTASCRTKAVYETGLERFASRE